MGMRVKVIAMAVLFSAYCIRAYGQAPPVSILEIEVENLVMYQENSSDLSKFATDPNVTNPVIPSNFNFAVRVADIVAVNGQPAKGTFTENSRQLSFNTAPNPGQGIADTVRSAVNADTFEILKSDLTPIGTIVSYGLAGGSPPPGATSSITRANYAITGGTGAFFGARGQWGTAVTPETIAVRQASVTEDPANRRRNGGGRSKYVLQVIPMYSPQIVVSAGWPSVAHSSDSAFVNYYNPAAAGEILSLFVTGLGPTKPGVDPDQPFPASPLAVVNAPVNVTVNGKSAQMLSAAGFPGAVGGYEVKFQVPSDTAKGDAIIQVTAAWIAGPEVSIPVQ
jgi:uncharacterized protein (TIGR03437 family)